MTNFKQLQPIESETEIRRAQALIAEVIEDPSNFKAEWVKQHSWTVVPVESCDHFDDADIRLLSVAFRNFGHPECLAVATEPLENTPLCYRVPATEEGLREFNEAVRNFFFILIPEDRSCAVLCTKNDYYLVGGPLAFVSMGVGGDIVGARTKFAAFVQKSPHPTMREILRDTAARYEPEGPARVFSLERPTRP